MRGRLIAHLKTNRMAEKRKELVTGLKEKSDVKVLLEPPRTEIALDGAAFTIGDKEAAIVLVEFSDYECPFSMRAQETVHRVLEEYQGKVHYVFFDYPLSFHRNAQKAHEAARCAGEQGKYAEYKRKLFENQKALGVEDLKKYAGDLGLDTAAFDSCLDSGKSSATVQASIEKGGRAGVTGTPAFFVNGIMISGARPFEMFQEVIEAELAR
jgi:protein-disulfide isomerase